jgi:steroid delta-isomerase-like uncharacterized protein
MKKVLCIVPLAILFCFTIACQDKAAMAELEKYKAQVRLEEQNKELVRKVIEELNKGNDEFLKEANAPDYAYYFPSTNPKSMSNEEVMAEKKIFREGFPDLEFNIIELVAVGDLVVSRYIVRGTHKGTFQGVPATGNKVEISVMNWCHLRDGKIVTEREEYDTLSFMQQLGMELKPIAAKKK